jgi:hypothetical protein
MSLEREERHLPILIAVCFVGDFVLGGIGQSFPDNSFWQLFSWQWGSLLFMAGTSLYAAKLHTEKWHISSAGFILLSIGQGIFYTINGVKYSSESVSLYATGIMVFLPGMLFLCYYSGFPLWLRILGVLSILPFLVVMIKIDMKNFNEQTDIVYSIISFILTQITGVCWSYFAIRPYRKTKTQH